MSGAITFTLDLEDHRPDESAELRYPRVTRMVLEHLAGQGVTGTFFVVGIVAEAEPDLVREVAAAGHEIGYHTWDHTPLVERDEASLREDLRRGKGLLEDLAGDAVVGFRAPTFSLVESTTWATDVIADEGFTYSSSVLPAANPLYGYPGAPLDPFLWPSGLAEFPSPLGGVGRFQIPYLGGTYLRLLPRPLISAAHRRATSPVPWTYMHPYDVDPGERYWREPVAGVMAPLLWVGRRRVLTKLDHLLDGSGAAPHGVPLRDRIDEARAGGTYDPSTMTLTPTPTPNPTPPAPNDEER